MARTVRDSQLESRAARSRLKARGKPYWRLIESGLHVGYRKPRGRRGRPATAGAWVVRHYLGHQSYRTERIAIADDYSDADGVVVLDFRQAQAKARKYMVERATPGQNGPLTVAACLNRYFEFLEAEGKSARDARLRAEAHVVPQLGDILASSLTADVLRTWLVKLAKSPARIRSKADEQKYQTIDADDKEAARKRRASANRVLVTLKASLSHAYSDDLIANDGAWRRVKPFRDTHRAQSDVLTPSEWGRVITACDQANGSRDLVRAALLTGCRYGELSRLVASDFNARAGTLQIRISKSKKSRFIHLSDEGVRFFKQLAIGKSGDHFLLTRFGRQWKKNEQSEPLAKALARAKIGKKISFHSLRHSHATALAESGVPILVLAKNLGHTTTRMTERYYVHLSSAYEADQIRAGVPDTGFKPDRKLTSLKSA
jgi:integrase